MSLPYSKSGFIPELNGLRGVAILGVMLFHSGIPFFLGGFIGVDIFFVLSGFLITRILVNEFNRWKAIDLKNFYIRRVLRLVPALILLLAVYCLASFIFLPKESAREHYLDALITLTYWTNWARAFNIHPPDYLSHTWSLGIEEQFYILWPIFLYMLLRKLKNKLLILWTALGLALSSWLVRITLTVADSYSQRLYNGLDTHADGLMLGCAIGIMLSSELLTENVIQKLAKRLTLLAPIASGGLLSLMVVARWAMPLMYYVGFTLVELFTAILLMDVILNPHSMTKKLLSSHWLVRVGTISYGVYLWHYPIYRVLQTFGLNEIQVFLAGSPLALIVAALSYQFLESPILRQKDRFSISSTTEPAGN